MFVDLWKLFAKKIVCLQVGSMWLFIACPVGSSCAIVGVMSCQEHLPASEKSFDIFFLGLVSGILSIHWYNESTSTSSKYSSMSTRVNPFNCFRAVIVSIIYCNGSFVNNDNMKIVKYWIACLSPYIYPNYSKCVTNTVTFIGFFSKPEVRIVVFSYQVYLHNACRFLPSSSRLEPGQDKRKATPRFKGNAYFFYCTYCC